MLIRRAESGVLVTEDYSYDGNNRLLATSRGGHYTSLRTYDAGGRLIEAVSYSSPGVISERRSSTYNANGWLTQQTARNSANVTQSLVTYSGYDGVGNVTQYSVQVFTGTAYTNTYNYTYLRFDSYKEQTVAGSSTLFQPGSTTTAYDVNGNPLTVSETFATSKNRSFVTNQAGQILAKTENGATQRYFFLNDNPVGSAGALAAADFDYNYTPVSERYPAATPDSYVVSAGDTLRSIALALFGDAQLWYLIADANGLQSDADLVTGRNLTIPNQITNLHNDAQTFKPYAPSAVIGDTTPTLPDPPPPPAKKGGCAGIGGLLIAVVVIVVAAITQQYYLANIATALTPATATAAATFSVATSVAAAAAGAAVGNIAGQVVGNITGLQKGFSFSSLAVSVVSAGLTQGIAGNIGAPGFNLATAARAGIGSVVNQGLNILVGRQNKFDWKGLAAAAIAAPVAAGLSNVVSGSAAFNGDKIAGVDPNKIDFGPRFAGSFAGGVAATTVRQVVYGGGKMNFAAVAADAFGNAVGNAIVGALQASEIEAQKQAQKESFLNSVDQLVKNEQITSTEQQTLKTDAASGKASSESLSILARLLGDSAENVKTSFVRPEGAADSDIRFAGLSDFLDDKDRILDSKRQEFFDVLKQRGIDLTVSVGGILTGEEFGVQIGSKIANATNTLTLVVNNPTAGPIFDLLQSAGQILTNFEDPLSLEVKRTITDALEADKNGKLTVVAHSQGTIVTSNVLSSLKDAQRFNIDYVSIATATPFVPSGLNSYKGFINPFDVVPIISGGFLTGRVNLYSALFDSYKNYSVTSTPFFEGNNHSFDLYLKQPGVPDALIGTKK